MIGLGFARLRGWSRQVLGVEPESILGVMGGSQSLCCRSQILCYPVKIESAQVPGLWTLDLCFTITNGAMLDHLNFRVERSAEAGKKDPSETRQRRVRRKKKNSSNSNNTNARQQRRRWRRKWRKGGKKGRPESRKNCGCSRSDAPSDDCLSTALKYQHAVSAIIANLKRLENRSELAHENYILIDTKSF